MKTMQVVKKLKLMFGGIIVLVFAGGQVMAVAGCYDYNPADQCGPDEGTAITVKITDCHGSQVVVGATVIVSGIRLTVHDVTPPGAAIQNVSPCTFTARYTDPCTGQSVDGTFHGADSTYLGGQCPTG